MYADCINSNNDSVYNFLAFNCEIAVQRLEAWVPVPIQLRFILAFLCSFS